MLLELLYTKILVEYKVMDRLLDSYRLANNQTYAINYFLIGITTLFLLGGSFYYKNGLMQYLQAPTTIRNIGLYFLAGVVFMLVIYTLVRSQTSTSQTATYNPFAIKKIPKFFTFWSPNSKTNTNTTEDTDFAILTVTENDWKPINKGLTIGIELQILDSRSMTSTNPYRCLFYKGSSDLTTYNPNSPGLTPRGSGGLSDGLPSEMAPGIFLDRVTNDIIVFVDTVPIDPIYSKMCLARSFRESIRINDLPLNVPFHLHLTLNDKILEVYVNCRLAGTKLLHGLPRIVPNTWFGRAGFAAADAIIQNFTIYDGALDTYQLMQLCKVILTTKPCERTCNKKACSNLLETPPNVPNTGQIFNYRIHNAPDNILNNKNTIIISNDTDTGYMITDTNTTPPLM